MNKYIFPMLLAVSSQYAQSQEANYELVTTAVHKQSSETALPVTIMTKELLQQQKLSTLGDALSNQPGINKASFGPAVGQVVIRGQQGRRVMSMSNGIADADASGNSADHANTTEALLASSIEVLRGPSTLLYGSGAIGGVVNVLDNRIPVANNENLPAFAIETRYDSAADLGTLVAKTDFTAAGLNWHLDARKKSWNDLTIPGYANLTDNDSSYGVLPDTSGKSHGMNFGVAYKGRNGFVGFSSNLNDNYYGLPPSAHHHDDEEEEEIPPSEDHDEAVFIDLESKRYDFRIEYNSFLALLEKIDYRLSHTDYQHAEKEGEQTGTVFKNDAWQQRLQINHQAFNNWHGVMGLQHSNEDFSAQGEESFIPATTINTLGLFVVEDYHRGPLTLEMGFRANKDSLKPNNGNISQQKFNTNSLSSSVLWDVNQAITLGLALSHSQRAPSVEELYSNYSLQDISNCVIHFATQSCEVGDINLKEETSRNIDFTLFYENEHFSLTSTIFHNKLADYIYKANTGTLVDDYFVYQYTQGNAKFTGLEVEMSLPLTDIMQLNLFADTITGTINSYGNAPNMPPARIGSLLDIKLENWSIFVSTLHAYQQDKAGVNETVTPAYTRWDAGIDYKVDSFKQSQLNLFVRFNNIGNEDIRLSTSYLRNQAPEAGRSLEAGIRYEY